MQALINKLHFGHSLLASGIVTLTASFALFMGHIDGLTLFRIIGSVTGVLILSVLFARFE